MEGRRSVLGRSSGEGPVLRFGPGLRWSAGGPRKPGWKAGGCLVGGQGEAVRVVPGGRTGMTHPPRQGFPEISTLPWFSLFAPLMGLLIIRATRDLVDDIVSVVGGAWRGGGCGGRALTRVEAESASCC